MRSTPVRFAFCSRGTVALCSVAGVVAGLGIACNAYPQPMNEDPPARTTGSASQTGWQPIAIVPPEAVKAGVNPGGEGCQWPRGPVVVSQSDPNFMLLPIDVGGLYRTMDGGKRWRISMTGWNARGANDFAIDPKNPNFVLGVAGNSLDWGKDWGPSPHGIYLSTDKAGSWKHVLAVREGIGGAVAYDPSSFDKAQSRCLTAYYLSPRQGLFRTDNGGQTWTNVAQGDAVAGRVDRDWTQGGTINALLKVTGKGVVYIGGGKGLYKSTDKGKTWTTLQTEVVHGLDVDPTGRVYQSGAGGLAVSSDDGKTWKPLQGTGINTSGKPIERVTVSPADPKRMTAWVAGDNWKWVRYISHDGGATFQEMTIRKGFAPMAQNVRNGFFAWHPTDPNICYGLGGDWVTRSVDGGKTFDWHNNGYNGVMVGGGVNFSPHNPQAVFLAFQDYNGAFTRDGGKTWNYRDVSGKGWGGHDYGGYTVDGQTLWCGDSEGWGDKRRLRLSRDGGETWNFVNGPDNKPLEWNGADVSFASPTDKRICFASDLRSPDGGATWERMATCDGVYTANARTGALYGKKGNAVVTSKDNGATWQTIAEVPGGLADIAVDAASGKMYVASEDKLKMWDGNAWSAIATPADQYGNTRVWTVATDPQAGVIYVGGPRNTYTNHATICRTIDGGKTWRNLTPAASKPGLNNIGPHEVSMVRVHPVTREAWAMGQCFGVWKIAPPTKTEIGKPAQVASVPRAVAPPTTDELVQQAATIAK